MILKVARLGHPVLRQVAEPVPPDQILTPAIQQFIDDMIETMHEYDGAGLAAPQVHVSTQIVIMEVGPNPRRPNAPSIPLTVYINPEITPLTEDMEEGWEGCLSVPGLRGRVPRYTNPSACLRPPGQPHRHCRAGVPRPRHPARVRPCARQGLSRSHALWSP